MQRASAGGSGSAARAPSRAGAGASSTSSSSSAAAAAKEETFILRATPSIKRYNIARFDTPTLPRFQACAQPVLMFREPERAVEEDEEGKEEEPVGYNPALRKRRRRRRKDTRTAGWVIEDHAGQTKFNGVFEGGQSSTYMLLVKNRHNDEFSVMPVEQWFRFKKPLSYRTLTLEEAEDLNNEKKRAVERWLMKHRLAGEDKADAGETVSAPRVRTGAVGGGGDGGGARAKKAGGADDIFEVQENRPKRATRPPKKAQEGAQGEDGGDFDEKFDDDESEAEIEHEDTKAAASDSEDEEFEVDPEGTGKLTETGQAMKDLLKRAQSGEMGDASKENDENDDEDGSDDDYSAKDMDKIKRDLGGNIIRSEGAGGAEGVKTGAGSSSADAGGGAGGDATASNGAAAKGASGGAGDGGSGNKRKADEISKGKDETPTKAAKPSGGSGSSSTANKLSEAGVQQELIRYGGRMRTRDLLKKLKKLMVTDNDRALLKDILRTICDVEVDAIDGRLLVLKSQFR